MTIGATARERNRTAARLAWVASRRWLRCGRCIRLYWPSVLFGSLAFCALFFLFGTFFRRPAIVAIVYSFFLEVILQLMPGTLKRVSIGYYVRCMMYEEAGSRGLEPANPILFAPVSGSTALWVLVGATVGLLALGMALFQRTEYDVGD